MFATRFKFLEPPLMTDGELALVEPSWEVAEAHLATGRARGVASGELARQRVKLGEFLRSAPRGRKPGSPSRVPEYAFWMQTPEFPMAGQITLRVGRTPMVTLYAGHIGYRVEPAARGHHYAARACRLVYPFARAHGLKELWITCAPGNRASWRSAELAGGIYVETVECPPNLFDVPQRARFRVEL